MFNVALETLDKVTQKCLLTSGTFVFNIYFEHVFVSSILHNEQTLVQSQERKSLEQNS